MAISLSDLGAPKPTPAPAPAQPSTPAPVAPATATPAAPPPVAQGTPSLATLLDTLTSTNIPNLAAPAEQVDRIAPPLTIDELSNYQFPGQPDTYGQDDTEILRTYLDGLIEKLGSSEISEQLMKTLKHLEAHPHLQDRLLPEDVGAIVAAMKSSLGATIQKKETKRTTKQAKKDAAAGVLADLASVF